MYLKRVFVLVCQNTKYQFLKQSNIFIKSYAHHRFFFSLPFNSVDDLFSSFLLAWASKIAADLYLATTNSQFICLSQKRIWFIS